MSLLLKAAQSHIAAIAPPAAPDRATDSQWEEWLEVGRVLRSRPVRQDRVGRWKPMQWLEVAKWLHGNCHRSRIYSAATLAQALSSRDRASRGRPKLTRKHPPPPPLP